MILSPGEITSEAGRELPGTTLVRSRRLVAASHATGNRLSHLNRMRLGRVEHPARQRLANLHHHSTLQRLARVPRDTPDDRDLSHQEYRPGRDLPSRSIALWN
jgi:hypothetical protein